MPAVPAAPQQSLLPQTEGQSPATATPSPQNLLMAAAEMQQMGKFDDNQTPVTPYRPKGGGHGRRSSRGKARA